MSELKTLKDLDNRMYRSKSCQLLMRRLKAEAVKWVKKYDYDAGVLINKNEEGDGFMGLINLARKYTFMSFFNLTEEDLK